MNQIVFGLTGKNCGGKTEFSNYLRGKGFEYLSFSVEMGEECREKGLEPTRENLINMGNEQREKHGNDYWAKKLIQKIEPGKNYIAESFRNPVEVESFKKMQNFRLVLVSAPIETRFERSKSSERLAQSFRDFEEFKMFEEKEASSPNKSSQQLNQCAEMADLEIVNDSSVEEFNKKIDSLLEKLNLEGKND